MKHKGWALGLVAIGIAMGLLATMKSELEAAIVEQVATVIDEGSGELAWDEPLSRLTALPGSEQSWDERLTHSVLHDRDLKTATLLYIFIAALGAVLAIASVGGRATIRKTLYASLYGEALRKALVTESRVALANRPEQETAAVQQGATGVADAFAFWAEAGQYMFALATAVAILITIDIWFGAICLVVVAINAAISRQQARRLEKARNEYERQRNDLTGQTDDVLTNRDIILANERGEHFKQKLGDLADDYAKTDRRLSVREERYQSLVNFTSDVGRIVVLLVGVLIALSATNGVERVGDAYFLIAVYARVLYPMQSLLAGYDLTRKFQATANTFVQLLDAHEESRRSASNPHRNAPSLDRDAIRFEGVHFSYGDGKRVLSECSFNVPSNKTTLLVGRSGKGKTTICRLLLAFVAPTQGRVLVEGKSVASYEPNELRLRLSYLSQVNHVIDDNLRENLFVAEGTSDEVLLDVLRRVGLATNVGDEPLLQRRAVTLSGGERQRLALARILLDKAPIAILDEPLAGIDVFTLEDLEPELTEYFENERTVLLMSHRLAFASFADHIVVLGDEGEVVEQGPPEELTRRNTRFSQLHAAALRELTRDEAEGV